MPDKGAQMLTYVFNEVGVPLYEQVYKSIKNDIIKVISKYMEIDEEELDIQITKTESEDHRGMIPVMVANIPIRDIKHKGN